MPRKQQVLSQLQRLTNEVGGGTEGWEDGSEGGEWSVHVTRSLLTQSTAAQQLGKGVAVVEWV